MKALARLALKILTGISSVFIAACYGIRTGERPLRSGIVVDSQTGARIPGILVSCIGIRGSVAEQDITDAQGEFAMQLECSYRAEDIDGGANGSYATTTASFPGDEPVVIRLDPVP